MNNFGFGSCSVDNRTVVPELFTGLPLRERVSSDMVRVARNVRMQERLAILDREDMNGRGRHAAAIRFRRP